jgi:hypothetical protein
MQIGSQTTNKEHMLSHNILMATCTPSLSPFSQPITPQQHFHHPTAAAPTH